MPETKRKAARYITVGSGQSERHACVLVGISRSSYRDEAVKKDEDALRGRIWALAMRHRRYGSPRICAMLKREGLVVNHKQVERIYRQEKLMLRRKSGYKRKISSPGIKPVALRPMLIWSIDFVSDSLTSGARFRALTILDKLHQGLPRLLVGASLPGSRVTTYLDGLAVKYGYPEILSMDNGPGIHRRLHEAMGEQTCGQALLFKARHTHGQSFYRELQRQVLGRMSE